MSLADDLSAEALTVVAAQCQRARRDGLNYFKLSDRERKALLLEEEVTRDFEARSRTHGGFAGSIEQICTLRWFALLALVMKLEQRERIQLEPSAETLAELAGISVSRAATVLAGIEPKLQPSSRKRIAKRLRCNAMAAPLLVMRDPVRWPIDVFYHMLMAISAWQQPLGNHNGVVAERPKLRKRRSAVRRRKEKSEPVFQATSAELPQTERPNIVFVPESLGTADVLGRAAEAVRLCQRLALLGDAARAERGTRKIRLFSTKTGTSVEWDPAGASEVKPL